MRLVEVYTSVQGEGPNTGVPIQFVRFGGCNMRCPGWPCDTQHAIQPQFRDRWIPMDMEAVNEQIDAWPAHICITGGEPFLQKEMDLFIANHLEAGWKIDVFTNGSFPLFWGEAGEIDNLWYIMDWKLVGSGEAETARKQRLFNANMLRPQDGVKFVVKNEADLWEAKALWETTLVHVNAQFWVGAAWGHISDREIVEFVLQHQLPWRLNTQVHKHIWEPEKQLV